MIKTFIKGFFLVDLCVVIYALLYENYYWLLNSQVAFFSSFIISLTSFISYGKKVKSKIKELNTNIKIEDKNDDPYSLYDDNDIKVFKKEDLTSKQIKEIIEKEKENIKKTSFKNKTFYLNSFISIEKIIGYAFLIFSFFVLNNHNLFIPIAFLIGLSVVPISIIFSRFILKLEVNQ